MSKLFSRFVLLALLPGLIVDPALAIVFQQQSPASTFPRGRLFDSQALAPEVPAVRPEIMASKPGAGVARMTPHERPAAAPAEMDDAPLEGRVGARLWWDGQTDGVEVWKDSTSGIVTICNEIQGRDFFLRFTPGNDGMTMTVQRWDTHAHANRFNAIHGIRLLGLGYDPNKKDFYVALDDETMNKHPDAAQVDSSNRNGTFKVISASDLRQLPNITPIDLQALPASPTAVSRSGPQANPDTTPRVEGGNLGDEMERDPLRYVIENEIAEQLGVVFAARIVDALMSLALADVHAGAIRDILEGKTQYRPEWTSQLAYILHWAYYEFQPKRILSPRDGLLALKQRIYEMAQEEGKNKDIQGINVWIDGRISRPDRGTGKSTFASCAARGLHPIPGWSTQSIDAGKHSSGHPDDKTIFINEYWGATMHPPQDRENDRTITVFLATDIDYFSDQDEIRKADFFIDWRPEVRLSPEEMLDLWSQPWPAGADLRDPPSAEAEHQKRDYVSQGDESSGHRVTDAVNHEINIDLAILNKAFRGEDGMSTQKLGFDEKSAQLASDFLQSIGEGGHFGRLLQGDAHPTPLPRIDRLMDGKRISIRPQINRIFVSSPEKISVNVPRGHASDLGIHIVHTGTPFSAQEEAAILIHEYAAYRGLPNEVSVALEIAFRRWLEGGFSRDVQEVYQEALMREADDAAVVKNLDFTAMLERAINVIAKPGRRPHLLREMSDREIYEDAIHGITYRWVRFAENIPSRIALLVSYIHRLRTDDVLPSDMPESVLEEVAQASRSYLQENLPLARERWFLPAAERAVRQVSVYRYAFLQGYFLRPLRVPLIGRVIVSETDKVRHMVWVENGLVFIRTIYSEAHTETPSPRVHTLGERIKLSDHSQLTIEGNHETFDYHMVIDESGSPHGTRVWYQEPTSVDPLIVSRNLDVLRQWKAKSSEQPLSFYVGHNGNIIEIMDDRSVEAGMEQIEIQNGENGVLQLSRVSLIGQVHLMPLNKVDLDKFSIANAHPNVEHAIEVYNGSYLQHVRSNRDYASEDFRSIPIAAPVDSRQGEIRSRRPGEGGNMSAKGLPRAGSQVSPESPSRHAHAHGLESVHARDDIFSLLRDHCLFNAADELPASVGLHGRLSGMTFRLYGLREPHAFRGMRVSMDTLRDILRDGLLAEKSSFGRNAFTSDIDYAASRAFYPMSMDIERVPTRQFVSIIFQIAPPFDREVEHDIDPRDIEEIYIFDREEASFVNLKTFQTHAVMPEEAGDASDERAMKSILQIWKDGAFLATAFVVGHLGRHFVLLTARHAVEDFKPGQPIPVVQSEGARDVIGEAFNIVEGKIRPYSSPDLAWLLLPDGGTPHLFQPIQCLWNYTPVVGDVAVLMSVHPEHTHTEISDMKQWGEEAIQTPSWHAILGNSGSPLLLSREGALRAIGVFVTLFLGVPTHIRLRDALLDEALRSLTDPTADFRLVSSNAKFVEIIRLYLAKELSLAHDETHHRLRSAA